MTDQEIIAYDQYAASALNALISKIPIVDREGEFSEQKPQEHINTLQKEISNAAHWYAVRMMEKRKQFIEHTNTLINQ